MAADETNGNSSRITVSRETLRAELAELELRLTMYLDKQLYEKANKVEIVALQTAVQDKANAIQFEQLTANVKELAREVMQARFEIEHQKKVNTALKEQHKELATTSEASFTRKEKLIGGFLALVALGFQAYMVTQGGGIG